MCPREKLEALDKVLIDTVLNPVDEPKGEAK